MTSVGEEWKSRNWRRKTRDEGVGKKQQLLDGLYCRRRELRNVVFILQLLNNYAVSGMICTLLPVFTYPWERIITLYDNPESRPSSYLSKKHSDLKAQRGRGDVRNHS
jgi:hypothetical protein